MSQPASLARRTLLAALLSSLALPLSLLGAGPAAAHAIVVTSEPAVGAALAAAPRQVTIRFNSRLDHARSRLLLIGADNAQIPLPIAEESDPVVLAASLPATIAPGEWRLRWQVLAIDGHITRGDIPFTLKAP
ncbi:copper resistance protein CopC [Belnapia sp. T18]|uniref:Copper resistance protein CopC n=1 Tax=Belnapia arida TaxID=2804533 RepID=A0ABS1U052_9PROT|nr:copper resistance CopC family protein [Belnapia arida]MBL6078044.1 copper resistance protein CopC [Belnapia arida]